MSRKILARKSKNKTANLVLIKKGYDIVNFFVPYFEMKKKLSHPKILSNLSYAITVKQYFISERTTGLYIQIILCVDMRPI